MALKVTQQQLEEHPEGAVVGVLALVIEQLNEIKYEAGGALQPQVDRLIGEIRGVQAMLAAPPPEGIAPVGAPVNVDVPMASQEGPTTLNCTMGNWEGEPTSYGYVWLRDGVDVDGGDQAQLTITAPDDIGQEFACEVTATNDHGSTAILSNTVTTA